MKFDFRLRFAAFALGMGVMVIVIGSSAMKSRQRTTEVCDRLVEMQSENLHVADQLRQSLRELHLSLVRYASSHDQADWDRFNKTAGELDVWIDIEKPKLNTPREKQTMQQIDTAYDDYRNAAKEIRMHVEATPLLPTPLAEFTHARMERERLTELGLDLAEAHQERTNQLLAAASQSAARLQILAMSSLALLVVLGAGFGLLAYRDLIAPLRVKLVESQALIERNEKLASLGMLAAGVAHEIRNPLTAIKAALFLQLKRAEPGSQNRADLELVGKEITRLENIVRDFLQFARPAEPRLVTVPVEQLLRQVGTLFTPQLGKSNIRLSVEPAPNVCVRVDPEQIHQALINLVQNAADAIGQDGAVTLRARLDSRPLSGRTTEVALLEVIDTGPGIPPDVAKRLFDPFFSTKSAGTGLGLSIAARIVEKHGGTLQYKTQLNHGTTFGIVLPRCAPEETRQP